MAGNKFVLLGYGTYENKGCEAIVRGTTKIIDSVFGNNNDYIVESWFETEDDYQKQKNNELNKKIKHKDVSSSVQKWSEKSFKDRFHPNTIIERFYWRLDRYFLGNKVETKRLHANILDDLKDCKAALCVGGDNYSLDYCIPDFYINTDDLILSYKKPCIIWGASVGPFSAIPEYEKSMARHLKKVTAIFAREDWTVEYLDSIGVKDNVYRVSDPAFTMNPVKPQDFDSLINIKESIGINLSPLMAKYWTDGNLDKWVEFSVNLVDRISKKFDRPVYLIPHVVVGSDNNDYLFLKKVKESINSENIYLLEPNYSAEESKYIISQLHGFMGARTHSTIAAFSTLVPTLSLAYSIKALGINKEVYGDLSYCLSKDKLSSIDEIVDIFISMMQDRDNIIQKMQSNIPNIKENAYKAGLLLKDII